MPDYFKLRQYPNSALIYIPTENFGSFENLSSLEDFFKKNQHILFPEARMDTYNSDVGSIIDMILDKKGEQLLIWKDNGHTKYFALSYSEDKDYQLFRVEERLRRSDGIQN